MGQALTSDQSMELYQGYLEEEGCQERVNYECGCFRQVLKMAIGVLSEQEYSVPDT